MKFKNPFNQTPKLESSEWLSDKQSLFKYLGEVGTRLLNKEISERAVDLALNSVTKYFTAEQLYKSLQEPEKKDEPPATKAEMIALSTQVSELRKRFDSALDPKLNRGMWG